MSSTPTFYSTKIPEYNQSTYNNRWFTNICNLFCWQCCSWWNFCPGLLAAVLGWPGYNQLWYFAFDLLPPDAIEWKHTINLELLSDQYTVTYSPDNQWIYLDPIHKHESTIIWIHGFTSRGDAWFNLFGHQQVAPLTSRIILPQAPFQKSTVYFGAWVFQWWDFMAAQGRQWTGGKALTIEDQERLFNQTEILQTTDDFFELIEKERLRFPPGKQTNKRIFLGGFSQGAMTSVATFVRQRGPDPLGGVIALAGLMPLEEKHFIKTKTGIETQRKTPLLLINGDADTAVEMIDAAYTYFYFRTDIFNENQENYTFLREEGQDHISILNKDTFAYIAHWLRDKTRNLDKADDNSGGNDPIKPDVKPDDGGGGGLEPVVPDGGNDGP